MRLYVQPPFSFAYVESLAEASEALGTDSCKQTRKEQNQTRGIFRRYSTASKLRALKKARAKAHALSGDKSTERKPWKILCLFVDLQHSPGKVWDRLRKIRAEYSRFSTRLLNVNYPPCPNLEEEASIFGQRCQSTSNLAHSTENSSK